MEHGISYYFEQGGISIYPLLLFSILGVAVALERAYYLSKGAKSLKWVQPRVLQAVQAGRLDEAQQATKGQYLGGVFETALEKRGLPEEQIVKALDRRRAQEIQGLKSRVWILGTIGSLSPFVGLFGTVVGIMKSFEEIARTQEGGFTTVSAGISESLIATAGGLLIGVLSILAYNFFSNQINQIAFKLKISGDELAEQLASAPRAAREMAGRK